MYIQEHIYYQSQLSSDQYTKIEGYLAYKWGLQANLPNNHPYKISAPLIPVTPNFINTNFLNDPSFNLWIDASNPTNFTYSSSNIINGVKTLANEGTDTRLMSIKGTANNITYLSSPSFASLPCIQLGADTSTSTYIKTNITNINYQYELTFFYVVSIDSTFSINDAVTLYGPESFSGLSNLLTIRKIDNTNILIASSPQGYSSNGNSTDVIHTRNDFTPNTFHLISFKTSLLGEGQTLGFNGNYVTNPVGAPLGGANNQYNVISSGDTQGNIPNILYIQEVLGFTRSLNTSDFQSIEGYLANKWGIQSKLASSHPYKNSGPRLPNPPYTF
jgi:hypothetical protein